VRVLVTGAGGFLGNNVCRRLIERGHQVRALVHSDKSLTALADLPSLQLCKGDVLDPKSLKTATARIQGVIHCGGFVYIGRKKTRKLYDINVEGTKNLLRVVSTKNLPMVFVSSIDAIATEGSLLSPYARTKHLAEESVFHLKHKAPLAIVRPGFMLGPNDWKPSSGRLLLEVINGHGRLAPPGNNLFCDVRDVAATCVAALERGKSEIYQPGGHCLSYYALFKLIAKITHCPKPIRQLRSSVVRIGGDIGDFLSYFRGEELAFNSVTARDVVERRSSDQLKTLPPSFTRIRPLKETIQDTWEWFRTHGYLD
jgi:dihydroflavonol-4-reductase